MVSALATVPLATIGNSTAATTANINRRRTNTARLLVVMAFPPPPEPDRLWALAQPSVPLSLAGMSVLFEPVAVNRGANLIWATSSMSSPRRARG